MLGGARLAAIFAEGGHGRRRLTVWARHGRRRATAGVGGRTDPAPSGILQRQPQLLRQGIDRRSLPLPRAVGFEPQRSDPAAPRRNHAADRAVVGAIGVLLIDALDHVRRDADERAQRGRRRIEYLRPFHADSNSVAICLR